MPDHAPSSNAAHPPTRDIVLSPKHRWRAYWVAVSVAALTILDLTKVNVALPSIESALNAGPTELQLVVSGYILTFGLVLVPAGRLGDLRSRRVLFLVGLSLFLVTSLVCALAPNTTVLLVARLLQGVAAGIQMPQVLGLVQQLFQGKERGRAFGLFGATVGIATAFGPTLGGLLIALGGDTDGWRLIFWINIPLVAIVIVLAAWLLPNTRTKSRRRLDLDPVGVLLFALTILALMWPFLFTTGSPDDDPRRWWFLVASVVFAAIFVFWERRYADLGRTPLMPFSIFSLSSYRNGVLISTAYFSAIPAMFLLGTLFLQGGLGLEPVFAGMVTIGFAVASAWSSWIGGNLVTRLGRPLVVWGIVGMVATAGGLVLVALFTPARVDPVGDGGSHGGRRLCGRSRDLAQPDAHAGRHPGVERRGGGVGRAARPAHRHGGGHGHRPRALLRHDLPRAGRCRHRRGVPRRLRVGHDHRRDLPRARPPRGRR
ncbi:MFS family permease [Microbacterium sp. SORGH_AS 969]|nr:MFS family permease [Microbacterium sp. SORGH_AS_0969]